MTEQYVPYDTSDPLLFLAMKQRLVLGCIKCEAAAIRKVEDYLYVGGEWVVIATWYLCADHGRLSVRLHHDGTITQGFDYKKMAVS